jgi:hypothetical protein
MDDSRIAAKIGTFFDISQEYRTARPACRAATKRWPELTESGYA